LYQQIIRTTGGKWCGGGGAHFSGWFGEWNKWNEDAIKRRVFGGDVPADEEPRKW